MGFGTRMMLKLVAVSLLVAAPIAAQGVRGTLVEQASRQPIAGAVVFLVDATSGVVARDLTSESGAYRLPAPRPGIYRVRTLRIGFKPVVSDAFTLGEGPDKTLDLTVESIPVSLTAVRVVGQANCPARAGATQAYNAWNEVTTALNAALLSSRMRNASATVVSYDRWTEPGSDQVLRQGANVRSGLPGQPWRSIGADSLRRHGFVVKDADGWSTFHAVDIDVLLSEYFLQDHCLQLADVARGEIAIGFTPARDRSRIAEIRGFVWLDATTLELKRLQFRYVNVEREYEEADAGGEIEFLKLRNGNWVVSRWQIRMPTAFREQRSGSYRGLNARSMVRATEVKTTGGDLLSVVQNGDTIWALPPRSFTGAVLDSASGRPVARARVFLAGTPYAVQADAAGRFTVDNLLPGGYTVLVQTPELDSLSALYRTSVVFTPQMHDFAVRVAPSTSIAEQWCPTLRGDQRSVSGAFLGVLMGTITAHDTSSVAAAEVVVSWNEFTINAGAVSQHPRTLTVTTDKDGVYRVCGVPTGTTLMLSTDFDGNALPTPVRIESVSRTRRYDIKLDAQQRRIRP